MKKGPLVGCLKGMKYLLPSYVGIIFIKTIIRILIKQPVYLFRGSREMRVVDRNTLLGTQSHVIPSNVKRKIIDSKVLANVWDMLVPSRVFFDDFFNFILKYSQKLQKIILISWLNFEIDCSWFPQEGTSCSWRESSQWIWRWLYLEGWRRRVGSNRWSARIHQQKRCEDWISTYRSSNVET